MRKLRDAVELRAASKHLYYEYTMMKEISSSISKREMKKRWLNNAALEAFIIHVRALIDFLFNDKPYEDDIIAQDFFISPELWNNVRPEIPDSLQKAKKRADKEMAHLTYARLDVSPQAKLWPFLKIEYEIDLIMGIFLNHIDQNTIDSEWRVFLK